MPLPNTPRSAYIADGSGLSTQWDATLSAGVTCRSEQIEFPPFKKMLDTIKEFSSIMCWGIKTKGDAPIFVTPIRGRGALIFVTRVRGMRVAQRTMPHDPGCNLLGSPQSRRIVVKTSTSLL